METTNQDILEKVIKLIDRWHKKEASKGSEVGLPMHQVYTQVRSTLPVTLKFSKALCVSRAPCECRGGFIYVF